MVVLGLLPTTVRSTSVLVRLMEAALQACSCHIRVRVRSTSVLVRLMEAALQARKCLGSV